MKRQTAALDPVEKLAELVLSYQTQILATARRGRATHPQGAMFVTFDETKGLAYPVYLPDAEAVALLAADQDQTLQEGYAVFSTLARLAPWMVIVIAYLYTTAERTYSVMTALDMYAEWDQERQKQVARWLN